VRIKRRQQQQQASEDDSDEDLMARAARAKQREGHKQVGQPRQVHALTSRMGSLGKCMHSQAGGAARASGAACPRATWRYCDCAGA